jgi:hypothetical protein
LYPTAGDLLLTTNDCVGDRPLSDLSADARLSIDPRLPSSRTERRIHTVAIYSSLALIAAVVFGTLSVHPF